MDSKLQQFFLKEIKSKNQIESLEDSFILQILNSYLLTNGQINKKLLKLYSEKGLDKIEKNKIVKEIVKEVRKEVGILYGSFLTNQFTKKNKYLEKENYSELLKSHKSTRERIEFYDEVYSKIFSWYKPKQIADLACGLNPLSYEIMCKYLDKKPNYFASDLNPSDMNFVQDYFNKNNIEGTAKAYDITTLKVLENKEFMKSDLIFLFKALDSFETLKKNISKELLNSMKEKHIVVSFPTKSLISKQEFKREKRNWFFNYLEKESWKYEEFEVENELFILIKK